MSATGSGESYFEFVIKVRRKRNSRKRHGEAAPSAVGGSEVELSAEMLGAITTAVTFPGLCDFQLLHAPQPVIDLDHPLLSGPLLSAGGFLNSVPAEQGLTSAIAPLLFSRYDYARDYAFAHHDNALSMLRQQEAQSVWMKNRAAQMSAEDIDKAMAVAKSLNSGMPTVSAVATPHRGWLRRIGLRQAATKSIRQRHKQEHI